MVSGTRLGSQGRRALLLFGLSTIAVTIVEAQNSPWGQIGGSFNNPLNPNFNPNNNNVDNNDDGDDDGNHASSTDNPNKTILGTPTIISGSNSDSTSISNGGFGGGIHGGHDGFAAPTSSISSPSLDSSGSDLDRATVQTYRDIHGILGIVSFLFLFPLGTIFMRLMRRSHTWLVHGVIQTLAYAVYVAGAGLGLKLVSVARVRPADTPLLQTAGMNAHPVVGIVLLVALFAQPVLGLAHHRHFVRARKRSWLSHTHRWLGRASIALGVINGGLGLLLADAPSGSVVAYAIISAIIAIALLLAALNGRRDDPKTAAEVARKEAAARPDTPAPDVPRARAPPPSSVASRPVSDLPPYTPGPHYGRHMAHIQQHREQESSKADFDVVPLMPVRPGDMYRGQVASPDEIYGANRSEASLERGQV